MKNKQIRHPKARYRLRKLELLERELDSQGKKDIDETQNVSISGDTKSEQGQKINIEYMLVQMDNHPDTYEVK